MYPTVGAQKLISIFIILDLIVNNKMAYTDVSSFVLASARIARSFSWRDARDALWNKYINVQLDNYRIIFSYAEGGVLSSPARLEFNVVDEMSGDLVARVVLYEYNGDRDDIPVIKPSTAERVASSLYESILDHENEQE